MGMKKPAPRFILGAGVCAFRQTEKDGYGLAFAPIAGGRFDDIFFCWQHSGPAPQSRTAISVTQPRSLRRTVNTARHVRHLKVSAATSGTSFAPQKKHRNM